MKRITFTTETQKRKKPIVIVLAILGIVVFSQLVVTNLLAGRGGELSELEQKVQKLSRENNELKLELSTVSSLTTVSKQASENGFVSAVNVVYLSVSQPVASIAQ